MGTSTRQATQGLKTQENELTKQFIIYDSEDRTLTVYSCGYLTPNNGECTRVDYTYINATSNNVEKMRESNDVWLAAYDI